MKRVNLAFQFTDGDPIPPIEWPRYALCDARYNEMWDHVVTCEDCTYAVPRLLYEHAARLDGTELTMEFCADMWRALAKAVLRLSTDELTARLAESIVTRALSGEFLVGVGALRTYGGD